ncbi:Helix-turn-helix [Lachnospiraceae bacterium NE2001]|nr:Helix-turn-helix [Lachnospiraceae bacterium NE2001]
MIKKELVGERLIGLRKENGLKRGEVAEAIDYSESAVKKAELGDNICLNLIVAFAEYYGVSIDYLIWGTKCDGDEMAIERLLRSVPEDKRELAVNAVKGVLAAFVSAD